MGSEFTSKIFIQNESASNEFLLEDRVTIGLKDGYSINIPAKTLWEIVKEWSDLQLKEVEDFKKETVIQSQ